MAEVLSEFPVGRGSGGPGKYDRFLDGQIWRVAVADVSAPSVNAVFSGVHQTAHRRGIKVRVKREPDGVVIQAMTNGHGKP